jgi:hypothetical protein
VKTKGSHSGSLHPILIGALIAAVGQSARSAPIEYLTPAAATTSGKQPVNAEAFFTLNNGSITLQLVNLYLNPTADSQLISGITFNITGASSSGSLKTTNSGSITTIGSKGSYKAGTSDPLTRWTANEAKKSTAITLTALSGGQPNHEIIGPDSLGGFKGAGNYGKANPSITNHNPVVLGSATFTITIAGVMTTSKLSNVVFQFGTNPDAVVGQAYIVTPEPSTALVPALAGVAGLASCLRRRSTKPA